MFDVTRAHTIGGGHPYVPAPIDIDGLNGVPATFTPCSQSSGDAATVLRIGYTGGRAKLFGVVKDFAPAEITLASTSGSQYGDGTTELASGYSVWFTLVAVLVGSSISIRAVPGAVATNANAVVATEDEIAEFLGLDDYAPFAILFDAKFYRSADTVITTSVKTTRRPAYVDDATKTGLVGDQADQSTLGARFHSFVHLHLDLATVSAKSAGALVIDGQSLPPLPFGGYLGTPEYIGVVAGAGAGADLTLLPNIDGTAVTGGAVQITLANTAIPAKVTGTAVTANHSFKPGATLDIELDVKTTVFSAGSGYIRIPVYEYVAR